MTLKTLRLSEGCVFYTEAGSGEPLVLLHGVGMCDQAWRPQITALQRRYRVIALNMPGHGGTDLLPGTPDLPDYVAWAARVLRAMGLGMANVAGHSMGALIATGLAASHPDLVRRVAVLNGVYRRSPEARAAVVARADALAKGANDVETPLARWFDADQQDLRAQVAGWLRAVNPVGYAAAYRAFAGGDATYADAWPQISCPVLALTGALDANSSPAMAQAMAAAAPRGRAVVIEGHRHMVNLTAPEAVTTALADWLAEPVVTTEGLRA